VHSADAATHDDRIPLRHDVLHRQAVAVVDLVDVGREGDDLLDPADYVFGAGPATTGVALFLAMWQLRAAYALLYIGFECAENCLMALHRQMQCMQQPLCSEKVRNDPLGYTERLSRCAEGLPIQAKIDK